MTQSATVTAGEQPITIDRRGKDRRDSAPESNTTQSPSNGKPQRRKQQRRRQIDPTTCERDYSEQEIEFMQAMDDYKRAAGRMFPTCSEVLEVVRSLGYVQLTEEQRREILGDEVETVEAYSGEAASDDDWDDDEL